MIRTSLNIAVIGSGISGAVCASILARGGASVTVFETARGPGGRMSQRRESVGDGKDLMFDHGAPYFSLENDSENEVMGMVRRWELMGLVAEWKENFGVLDRSIGGFLDFARLAAIKEKLVMIDWRESGKLMMEVRRRMGTGRTGSVAGDGDDGGALANCSSE